MKKVILSTLTILFTSVVGAQTVADKADQKVKGKTNQRVDSKADQTIDKGLDKIEECIAGLLKRRKNLNQLTHLIAAILLAQTKKQQIRPTSPSVLSR